MQFTLFCRGDPLHPLLIFMEYLHYTNLSDIFAQNWRGVRCQFYEKPDILVLKYVLNNSKSIPIKKNRKFFDFLVFFGQKSWFFEFLDAKLWFFHTFHKDCIAINLRNCSLPYVDWAQRLIRCIEFLRKSGLK